MNVWGSMRSAAGDARYAARMWLIGVGLPCLAIVLIGAVATLAEAHGHVASVPVSQSPRVCFPVKQWGPAPDRYAPCVRIRRVAEDGSFTFAVSDRDGTVRYVNGVGAQDR